MKPVLRVRWGPIIVFAAATWIVLGAIGFGVWAAAASADTRYEGVSRAANVAAIRAVITVTALGPGQSAGWIGVQDGLRAWIQIGVYNFHGSSGVYFERKRVEQRVEQTLRPWGRVAHRSAAVALARTETGWATFVDGRAWMSVYGGERYTWLFAGTEHQPGSGGRFRLTELRVVAGG